jgi:hypothetical protein
MPNANEHNYITVAFWKVDKKVICLLAHPIEGTLAGLNSRFYLDRHAR